MKKYIIVDKTTGYVEQISMWGDDREFDYDTIPLGDNQEVVTVDIDEAINVYDVYDFTNKIFYVLEPEEPEPAPPTELELVQAELAEAKITLAENQEAINFILMNY